MRKMRLRMWIPESMMLILIMLVCITSAFETEVPQNENPLDLKASKLESLNLTECYCGENSLHCFIWNDQKRCSCKYGFAHFNETCRECDCGEKTEKCIYDDDGNKKCKCKFGFGESRGNCVECDCGMSDSCHYDEKNTKICKCLLGYAEKNRKCLQTCKVDSDCEDGRICTEGDRDKSVCDCPPNYGGKSCKTNLICEKMDPPCKSKGAECVDEDSLVYCKCPPGKTIGLLSGMCEDLCNDDKCLHGKCEVAKVGDVAVSSKCVCDKGYFGMRCEMKEQSREEMLKFIILASINFVMFFLLSAMFCFMCRNRRHMV
ncbi:hypothetical protein NPIL_511571 [Nephila pilipes]|uniref:EGF-like domain-containing protein n=1 Tax=Nephila pilipes TaxID=299642 RepID=A0A8X6TBY8_NEPPI|nr:hypothetical protein NPIL_511571 [Nephila pilipes]